MTSEMTSNDQNCEIYSAFAALYDRFMDNIPYRAWAEHIQKILCKHNISDGLILDLGCGSGTITCMLSDMGYDMTGLDSSAEMLEEAMEKLDGRNILYLHQDIRDFELYGTMRAIISVCDPLNYITDKRQLSRVFRLVNNYLDPGGLFIFDMHTPHYYRDTLGCRSFARTCEDAAYIWENYFDGRSCRNEYYLTLFRQNDDGSYERAEEEHIERAYDEVYIRRELERAGLKVISVTDGYSFRKASENSERLVYTAQLPKNTRKRCEVDITQ